MIAVIFEFTPAPGFWRDEESVAKWRNVPIYGMDARAQAPSDSVAAHG